MNWHKEYLRAPSAFLQGKLLSLMCLACVVAKKDFPHGWIVTRVVKESEQEVERWSDSCCNFSAMS